MKMLMPGLDKGDTGNKEYGTMQTIGKFGIKDSKLYMKGNENKEVCEEV